MIAPPAAPPSQVFVGVDIAAASFAASWTLGGPPRERAQTFAQPPDGYRAFQTAVLQTGGPPSATLVVLEAPGSYWITLAVTLHQAGYAVSVIHPAHAHAFARSLPRRAKTDAPDAHLPAQCAHERQPPRWAPPEQVYPELRQRRLVRDGLLTMRQQTRNQRHALQHWPMHSAGALDPLDAVIADLATRIAPLEDELATVLRDGAWAESAALLGTIPSIGLVTGAWLPVATVNVAACAAAEGAAAYAGLAPLAHESGTRVRGRAQIGHGGHARLRTARYWATLTAARCNPVIRAQYERLRAAGQPAQVARWAAARQLLHLAYAVVTKKRAFDPASRAAQAGPVAQAAWRGPPARHTTPDASCPHRLRRTPHLAQPGVGRSYPVAESAPPNTFRLALDNHYRIFHYLFHQTK
jgi:transposase